MKKTEIEIYNTLRAFLLILIFASMTIFCILELEEAQHIGAAEPAEGVGRIMLPDQPEETSAPIEPLETIPAETAAPAETETHPEDIPFIRYPLTAEERYHVEAIVSAEAQGEDFDGQALIAQCILNTIEATGKTVYEVIYEPGQYASANYDEHHLVSAAVAAVFDDGYMVTGEPVRYFYAPARCYSAWHENSLEFVLEHGGHRFFKEG